MKKKLLSFFAVLALACAFTGKASAQNGVFAPYAGFAVSTSSGLGYSSPSYNGVFGIESSSKYVLLDLNGTVDSANPVRVLKTSGALATGTGYTLGLHGSAYYKLFSHFLIGGGANWDVNPATVVTTVKSGSVLLDAARRSANPFVGGGIQFGRERLLISYDLPGMNALPNEHKFDFHNEVMFDKGHVRLTQDVSIDSFFNNGTTDGTQIPETNIRVTGTNVEAGVKFVL